MCTCTRGLTHSHNTFLSCSCRSLNFTPDSQDNHNPYPSRHYHVAPFAYFMASRFLHEKSITATHSDLWHANIITILQVYLFFTSLSLSLSLSCRKRVRHCGCYRHQPFNSRNHYLTGVCRPRATALRKHFLELDGVRCNCHDSYIMRVVQKVVSLTYETSKKKDFAFIYF